MLRRYSRWLSKQKSTEQKRKQLASAKKQLEQAGEIDEDGATMMKFMMC